FFQAEDGIRDDLVTGVQTCALPIFETGEWIMREMQSPAGGYYSTLDADSEGHEGKFYVWSTQEIQQLVSNEDWPAIEVRYGLTRSEERRVGKEWRCRGWKDE